MVLERSQAVACDTCGTAAHSFWPVALDKSKCGSVDCKLLAVLALTRLDTHGLVPADHTFPSQWSWLHIPHPHPPPMLHIAPSETL